MTNPGDELHALVGAAVRGEPSAMDSLLRWINPLVVRYCRARLGQQERTSALADDVAQEVLLAVMTALSKYRDQGRPFLAFVYGIAAHKVADAHRSASRNRADPVADIPDKPVLDDGPEQRALQTEFAGRMGRLLGILPDKQREILVLRVAVGLTAEETAEAVGSTPGAVRVAQHRAFSRLSKMRESEAAEGSEADSGDWRHAPRTGDSRLDALLNSANRRIEQLIGEVVTTGPVESIVQVGTSADTDLEAKPKPVSPATKLGTGDAVLDSLLRRGDQHLRDKMSQARHVEEGLAMKHAAKRAEAKITARDHEYLLRRPDALHGSRFNSSAQPPTTERRGDPAAVPPRRWESGPGAGPDEDVISFEADDELIDLVEHILATAD